MFKQFSFISIRVPFVPVPEVSHLTEQEVLIADEILFRVAAPVADVDRHAASPATEMIIMCTDTTDMSKKSKDRLRDPALHCKLQRGITQPILRLFF